MGSFAVQHNIGSQVKMARGSANATATAGGAGDNTQTVGYIIDRGALGMPLSAVFAIGWKAILAATKTQSIAVLIEHGDDSALADVSTFLSVAAAVVGTGPAGGGTLYGVYETDVDLAGAKRYVRLSFTPDLSNTATDTGEYSSSVVFGGFSEIPQ